MQTLVTTPVSFPRLAIGTVLIAAGGGVFLAANTSVSAAGNMLLAFAVAVVGIGLLAGPWAWRLANQLMEERASRVRADARAEVAAHLHDSVLQTLALIQRASEPREMTVLARTQERELRAWLYGRAPERAGMRLRDAVDEMAGRVEAQHVSASRRSWSATRRSTTPSRALVAARGEATAERGQPSGRDPWPSTSRSRTARCQAFVRDQGSGFDPEPSPTTAWHPGVDRRPHGAPRRHARSDQLTGRHRGRPARCRGAQT